MTEFGRLNADGSYEHVRSLPQSAMRACPHLIMVPEHYRADNTCLCNAKSHTVMAEWGYVWDDTLKLWVAPEEDDDE